MKRARQRIKDLTDRRRVGLELGDVIEVLKANRWTPAWFHDQGLHQLMGTIRYPKAV